MGQPNVHRQHQMDRVKKKPQKTIDSAWIKKQITFIQTMHACSWFTTILLTFLILSKKMLKYVM